MFLTGKLKNVLMWGWFWCYLTLKVHGFLELKYGMLNLELRDLYLPYLIHFYFLV